MEKKKFKVAVFFPLTPPAQLLHTRDPSGSTATLARRRRLACHRVRDAKPLPETNLSCARDFELDDHVPAPLRAGAACTREPEYTAARKPRRCWLSVPGFGGRLARTKSRDENACTFYSDPPGTRSSQAVSAAAHGALDVSQGGNTMRGLPRRERETHSIRRSAPVVYVDAFDAKYCSFTRVRKRQPNLLAPSQR